MQSLTVRVTLRFWHLPSRQALFEPLPLLSDDHHQCRQRQVISPIGGGGALPSVSGEKVHTAASRLFTPADLSDTSLFAYAYANDAGRSEGGGGGGGGGERQPVSLLNSASTFYPSCCYKAEDGKFRCDVFIVPIDAEGGEGEGRKRGEKEDEERDDSDGEKAEKGDERRSSLANITHMKGVDEVVRILTSHVACSRMRMKLIKGRRHVEDNWQSLVHIWAVIAAIKYHKMYVAFSDKYYVKVRLYNYARERAAKIIQRHLARPFLCRLEEKRQIQAAICIQGRFRRVLHQRRKRNERSLITIQKNIRRFLVQKSIRIEKSIEMARTLVSEDVKKEEENLDKIQGELSRVHVLIEKYEMEEQSPSGFSWASKAQYGTLQDTLVELEKAKSEAEATLRHLSSLRRRIVSHEWDAILELDERYRGSALRHYRGKLEMWGGVLDTTEAELEKFEKAANHVSFYSTLRPEKKAEELAILEGKVRRKQKVRNMLKGNIQKGVDKMEKLEKREELAGLASTWTYRMGRPTACPFMRMSAEITLDERLLEGWDEEEVKKLLQK